MMKKCCNMQNLTDIGLLALRIALGVIFIRHGWLKFQDLAGAAGFFESFGIPGALFWAYVVAFVEFFGGLAVLLGVYLRAAAFFLGIVMIVALLVVHTKMPFDNAELPIALLGGLIALKAFGGGAWQLYNGPECFCGVKATKDQKKES